MGFSRKPWNHRTLHATLLRRLEYFLFFLAFFHPSLLPTPTPGVREQAGYLFSIDNIISSPKIADIYLVLIIELLFKTLPCAWYYFKHFTCMYYFILTTSPLARDNRHYHHLQSMKWRHKEVKEYEGDGPVCMWQTQDWRIDSMTLGSCSLSPLTSYTRDSYSLLFWPSRPQTKNSSHFLVPSNSPLF